MAEITDETKRRIQETLERDTAVVNALLKDINFNMKMITSELETYQKNIERCSVSNNRKFKANMSEIYKLISKAREISNDIYVKSTSRV